MLISTLLKNELKENRKLRDNIRCYTIASVNIEDFEKTFGKMPKDELIAFILDDSNGFELSKFGYRDKSSNKITAFNGKSNYLGVRCTVCTSDSNFHG